jgi:Cyclin-dependent kinase regulatory subunit
MASRIEYSEKYQDDSFEYRYDIADAACMPCCLHGALKRALLCESSTSLTCLALHNTHSLSLVLQRHVILPKELARNIPKSRCMTEAEWRGIGVQQSRGWTHYAIHR